jgi:hypothetical protein
MTLDSTKTPPAHELLQRFHGAKYMSPFYLNNEFLQFPLEESSLVWTAFHFDGQIYQFTGVLLGSVTVQPVLSKLCNLHLGRILQNMFSIMWMISLFFKAFEEHIKNLDELIGKGL